MFEKIFEIAESKTPKELKQVVELCQKLDQEIKNLSKNNDVKIQEIVWNENKSKEEELIEIREKYEKIIKLSSEQQEENTKLKKELFQFKLNKVTTDGFHQLTKEKEDCEIKIKTLEQDNNTLKQSIEQLKSQHYYMHTQLQDTL